MRFIGSSREPEFNENISYYIYISKDLLLYMDVVVIWLAANSYSIVWQECVVASYRLNHLHPVLSNKLTQGLIGTKLPMQGSWVAQFECRGRSNSPLEVIMAAVILSTYLSGDLSVPAGAHLQTRREIQVYN